MPKLTKRLIDALLPQTREAFVWDQALPGFGVRVLASGRKTYLVQYRDAQGRTRRYTLGAHGVLTLQQARLRAQEALAQVRAGENPAQTRQAARHAPTLADVAARFVREHFPDVKPASRSQYQMILDRYLLPTLGTRAMASLSRDDVAALHLRMRQIPYMANRTRSLLSTLFTWADTWGLVAEGVNPTRRVKAYKEFPRERTLTRAELARLGAVLREADEAQTERPELLALIRLLILTGARLRELMHLQWEWIDWDRGRLRLPDSKTGVKTLYLNTAALEVFGGLGRRTRGLVLPGVRPGKPMAHPLRAWRRICARASITDVRPHDLRHTYASMGVTLGLSLPIVGKMLGHSDPDTTARYAHLAPDPVEQAAQVVGEALTEAMGG